jgi:lipopolysaccharide export system permease protein
MEAQVKRFSLYLVKEILPLYFGGLLALVLLLLGAALLGVLADVISRGASPDLVAQFLLYILPSAASRGLPLALLFAALLGLTRLSQDSEIKAAFMLGLSPKAFAVPLLALGLGVTLFSFLNSELVVPRSSLRALEVQKDILIRSPGTCCVFPVAASPIQSSIPSSRVLVKANRSPSGDQAG